MDKTLQITLPDLQDLQAHVIFIRNKTRVCATSVVKERYQWPSVACKEIELLRLQVLKDHCRALFTPEAQAKRRAREAAWIGLKRLSPAGSTAYQWYQNKAPDPQEGELELYDEDIQIIIWRLQGHSYRQIGTWLNRSHKWVWGRVKQLKSYQLPPFIKIGWIRDVSKDYPPESKERPPEYKAYPFKERPLEAQRYWAWVIAWDRILRDPESALIWLQAQAMSGSGCGLWAPTW